MIKTVTIEKKGIKMIQVAIENLESYLKLRYNKKTAVLLGSEECHHCQELSDYLESIESNFKSIEIIRVNVTQDTHPLFAPPVIPSVIGFQHSVRIVEGAGMPENLLVVDNLLQKWEDDLEIQYSAG